MDPIIATERLINSVWTIRGKYLTDGTVEVSRYSRDDQEGYDRERELPRGRFIEDEDRVVRRFLLTREAPLGNVDYVVKNPRYVFDYKGDE